MYSITSEHVFKASLMTLGMTAAIVIVVGLVVYGLYRVFRSDDDDRRA